jgi:hypothetical protein
MNKIRLGDFSKSMGSDYVTREGDYLVVYSSVDMPDWYAREYRKQAVFFEGMKYFVAEKSLLGKGEIRYILSPWPDDLQDMPSRIIHYNEDYVMARDRALKQMKRDLYWEPILFLVKPLIGFCPSSYKFALQGRYGIDPQQTTAYSLWIEYLLLFVHCSLLVIGSFTTVFSIFYLLGVIFFLLPDVIVRYSDSVKENKNLYGFYEWLFKVEWK